MMVPSTTTADGKTGSTWRRMVVTAVLTAVVTAMSIAPAFAAPATYTCVNNADPTNQNESLPAKYKHSFVATGWTCTKNT